MTRLFGGERLLVSLPGAEAMRLRWQGSLARPQEVLAGDVSAALRRGLHLLRDAAEQSGTELVCVARPEMFCNDMALEWLRRESGGVSGHVCMSDGTAVKHVRGIATHSFFYGSGFAADLRALRQLCARAPEIMRDVRSQINTDLRFGAVRPAAVMLQPGLNFGRSAPALWRYYLNFHSAEDSANRVLQRGEVAAESLPVHDRIVYAALTDASMEDHAYAAMIARVVLRACFEPSMLLILRLPEARYGETTLASGIAAMLPGLNGSRVVLPRAGPLNVVMITEDIEDDNALLGRASVRLLLHESFEFWRHSQGFYDKAAEIEVWRHSRDFAPIFRPEDSINPVRERRYEVAPGQAAAVEQCETETA